MAYKRSGVLMFVCGGRVAYFVHLMVMSALTYGWSLFYVVDVVDISFRYNADFI